LPLICSAALSNVRLLFSGRNERFGTKPVSSSRKSGPKVIEQQKHAQRKNENPE
jgi:hypothetical protein